MTGLEVLAIASAVQAGGKMIKGGLDWLDGGKASKEELARLKTLRQRMNADAITNQDVQYAEQYGTRRATSTMNQAVDNARQAMAFQGMGSSGIANQVGLKEAQQLADAQTTQGIAMRERQRRVNKQHKIQAEDNLYNMKQQLANRRKAVMEQGKANMWGGAMDLLTLGAQQGMIGGGKTPTVPAGQEVLDTTTYDQNYEDLTKKIMTNQPQEELIT